MALFVLLAIAFVIALLWRGPPVRIYPRGGKKALDRPPAKSTATDVLDLVGVPVPLEVAVLGVLYVGVPKTGKTVALTRLERSLFRLNTRVVKFDFKNDALPLVEALLPQDRPVWVMNVFDSHPATTSLKIADTFTDFPAAQRLGQILVPEVKGDPQPFFGNSARILVVAVITVFQLCRKNARRAWRLRDVLAACAEGKLLKAILATHPSTAVKFAQAMTHSKTANDVFATIHANLSRYESYAVADFSIEREVSLDEFMAGNGVMVLGVDAKLLKVQLPLYQLVLQLVVEAALSRQGPGDVSVLSLDEIAMVENTGELIATAGAVGRSSNLAVLAATQSTALLRERLGKDNAEALLGMLQTAVVYRVDADTAKWAAETLGKYDGIIWRPSVGKDQVTWSADVIERYLVHPQEVQHQPLADAEADRLTCCIASSTVGSLRVQGSLLGPLAEAPPPGSYRYERRDLCALVLAPFDEQDCLDLGIPLTDVILGALSERTTT